MDSLPNEPPGKRKSRKSVVSRITAPQCPCPNLDLWICYFIWQRDFADVIKDLEWTDYPRLSKWAQCNDKCPYTGDRKQESQRCFSGSRSHSDVKEALGQGMGTASGSWKRQETNEPPEECNPVNTLIIFFFKLGYSCLIIRCQFLLYN